MNAAVESCLRLLMQPVWRALHLARANAGSNIEARIAMIAMTTSSSIRVKALRPSPRRRAFCCDDRDIQRLHLLHLDPEELFRLRGGKYVRRNVQVCVPWSGDTCCLDQRSLWPRHAQIGADLLDVQGDARSRLEKAQHLSRCEGIIEHRHFVD